MLHTGIPTGAWTNVAQLPTALGEVAQGYVLKNGANLDCFRALSSCNMFQVWICMKMP